MNPIPQVITSNSHTNLLNVYIQISNKMGFQPRKYVVINVRTLESHMHVADQCAPRDIANGTENLIL
jgi:hypothetical protein